MYNNGLGYRLHHTSVHALLLSIMSLCDKQQQTTTAYPLHCLQVLAFFCASGDFIKKKMMGRENICISVGKAAMIMCHDWSHDTIKYVTLECVLNPVYDCIMFMVHTIDFVYVFMRS